MMSNLYITADQVGIQTGGGVVTFNESEAMKVLGPCEVWGREQLPTGGHVVGGLHPSAYNEPWGWDLHAYEKLHLPRTESFRLAHFYAGTFSTTVDRLRRSGCKVTYTAAAHDVQASRRAHEELGVPFNYLHLTDPKLWERYVRGYLEADVLICPSTHSANVMRGFGATNRIEIIPHGCSLPECNLCHGTKVVFEGNRHLPEDDPGYSWEHPCPVCEGTGIAPITPLPPQFRLGYLGSYGADKSVVTLLKAWKKLNYSDAVLVLGGRDSNSQWTHALLQHCDYPRNVVLTGWVDDVSTFYNSISCYCQPSLTEGFGIEVLEAMVYGRAVICSTGAGAVDLLEFGMTFPAGDVDALAQQIHLCHTNWKLGGTAFPQMGRTNRLLAERYTWPKIRKRYMDLWRELLS